jgi:7,8-didemethyl-8-hydroxy-5-deazariboflavin synthase CofG subunit
MLPILEQHPISKESDLKEIMEKAVQIRNQQWGSTITYSRKVFVPLTNMCRDTCSYCAFVKHPDSPLAKIMSRDEVYDSVKQAEKMGCKEVLFSLGEKPEKRYEKARTELKKLGHTTMIGYLAEMCEWVLRNTSLTPHVNAGTLTEEEIVVLKPFSGSMGMMLETVSTRLLKKGMAHHGCPDKVPDLRLDTLEITGKLKVPFTTGILIGIGETFEERVESLEAIKEIHERYGHIQEVIIQNFQQKPYIKMANHPEPSIEDMLRTIATARIILPSDISIQAPPNLHERHRDYINAGINDWGGISPITKDFINPEHAWPEISILNETTKSMGFELKERFTVYGDFFVNKKGFVTDEIRTKLNQKADQNGYPQNQILH